MRNAVEEIGRAVERIDDPARLAFFARDHAALFEDKAPAGPNLQQLVIENPLGAHIRLGYKVGRAFFRYLEMLDFAKVPAQARSRLARGALHDGDKGGM